MLLPCAAIKGRLEMTCFNQFRTFTLARNVTGILHKIQMKILLILDLSSILAATLSFRDVWSSGSYMPKGKGQQLQFITLEIP